MSDFATSSILLMITAAGIVAVVTIGVASAARRAGFGVRPAKLLALAVSAGVLTWLAVTGGIAHSGLLAVWTSWPPRLPLLPLTATAIYVVLSRTSLFSRIVRAVPLWQPIAFQSFRLAVEFVSWRLHVEGRAPIQVTFEGSNFDGLVGLTAPFIAIGVAYGWIGKRSLVGWNLFGIAMLLTAIRASATSVPGPLHLDWPGEPFTALATWPVVWIPAFFAPTAILMHVTSIRQCMVGAETVLSETRSAKLGAVHHSF